MLRAALVSVFLTLSMIVCRADDCRTSDLDVWRQLSATFWASAKDADLNKPHVYVLAAPWCPYCAEYFRTVQARSDDIDYRFIPMFGRDDRSRKQVVDIAVEAGSESLARVFVGRAAKDHGLSAWQVKTINDYHNAAEWLLRKRYEGIVSAWGVPLTIIFIDNRLHFIRGMPNFDSIERDLKSQPPPRSGPSPIRNFLGIGAWRFDAIEGNARAHRQGIPLRLFPDEQALIASCADTNVSAPGDLITRIGGQDWLAFKFLTDVDWKVYIAAGDVEGWTRR